MFPANNVWNTPVDQLPVDPNSAAYVSSVGTTSYLHPDFDSTGGGIPYVVVGSTQPKVPVVFGTGASESDPGPYPIPANAPIEGGASASGDRHVLVMQSGSCMLYEMYAAYPQSNGSWQASSGAVFNLNSNQLRPAGWTSADAAGLPILPGLVRYDEVASGVINHAIRMTAPHTRQQYIWPARHDASALTGAQYPPMGQRFRLKASFDITPYPADVQVILTALKKYGAILADNGGAWYLTGAPDSRWNDANMHKLQQVLGSNLEAVDESSLMSDPNSGVVLGGLATLSQVHLSASSVTGGSAVTGQVVLSAAAPAGGVSVSLQSSNPAAASLPATVLVPGGATSASFNIQTSAVTASTAVTIKAFYLGVTTTATLTVLPPSPSAVAPSAVVLSPVSALGGTTVNCYLYLSAPAPAGGQTVTLTSSNPAAASVPAQLTFTAGTSLKYTVVTVQPVATASSVTISMAANGVTKSAVLGVQPAALKGVLLTASSVNGGGTITGTLLLGGVPAAPLAVTLASSNPAAASVPASVTVAAGSNTANFAISTKAVTVSTSVKITAFYLGVTSTSTLTVLPTALSAVVPSSVILLPVSALGGTTVNCYLYLSAPAPAGGQTVTLTSSNPAAASVPAQLTFTAGTSLKYAIVTVQPVLTSSSVTISMTANGVTKSAVLGVQPAMLKGVSLIASSVKGGGTITGTLLLGGVPARRWP